ncbi:MAG: HD domain-containing protein [Verrucomicrobiota bacterium]
MEIVVPEKRTARRKLQRRAVLELARSCFFDEPHARHVAKLALMLFDSLVALHKFKRKDRFWLECAAVLHDIGWIGGGKGHHKKSLNIIRDSVSLPFSHRRRLMVGVIARYHRRALPMIKHYHYSALAPRDREMVLGLAAILRVADGLDAVHRQAIINVSCKTTPDEIIIHYKTNRPVPVELKAAAVKSDLMKRVFKRKISFHHWI